MKLQTRKGEGLRFTDLLKPHYKAIFIGFLAVLGEAAANLLEPWPLKIVFDHVLAKRKIHGWFMQLLLGNNQHDPTQVLEVAVLAVVAIAAVGAIASYAEKFLSTTVAQWVTYDLRRTLYSHIQLLSLPYHDQKQTGDLISRVTSDIDSIQNFIVSSLLSAMVNCLTLAGMIGVMFYVNWKFTLIALSIVPPLFAIVYTYTRRIKEAARAVRKKEGEIVSIVEEVLSSIRVVKAFAREDYELQRLDEQGLEAVEISLRARRIKAKLTPLVEVLVACGTCLVLWFGARMVLAGSFSTGSLIIFVWYLGKMYKPMQDLSKMTDSYSRAAIGFERIKEVLDTKRQVSDLPGARTAPRFKGRIAFDRVRFSYTPGVPVLRDVSFEIDRGCVAALVGPTGAGKTTIISLIPRFYDPDSGKVTIDGHDVRRFTQKSLRHQMSFVLQETLLFRAPVWQNIAYGNPEARRAEILHAAEMANAHEFIEKLPEGYDTMLGEHGMTLSGGQRQRIAIARAIVRNTPILIMDEPSSNLDSASEKLVFEALDRLMAGKTTIVIAHRLSTVRNADIIFVLQDGTIIEQGKHNELLRHNGLYAGHYALQFQGAAAEQLLTSE